MKLNPYIAIRMVCLMVFIDSLEAVQRFQLHDRTLVQFLFLVSSRSSTDHWKINRQDWEAAGLGGISHWICHRCLHSRLSS